MCQTDCKIALQQKSNTETYVHAFTCTYSVKTNGESTRVEVLPCHVPSKIEPVWMNQEEWRCFEDDIKYWQDVDFSSVRSTFRQQRKALRMLLENILKAFFVTPAQNFAECNIYEEHTEDKDPASLDECFTKVTFHFSHAMNAVSHWLRVQKQSAQFSLGSTLNKLHHALDEISFR